MKGNLKLINNLSESGLYIPQENEKTHEDWREELLNFGLQYIPGRYAYEIPRQNNPLSIQIADERFKALMGENPRIYVPVSAAKDNIFMTVCRENDISIASNHGYCIKGYDFLDQRSVAELGTFLVEFEKQYLTLKLKSV